MCNQVLENGNHAGRIDNRSYERQGIDQIPTIHLGVAASQMEKRGIRTERGNINREIEVTNQALRQLRARIDKLQNWAKTEAANAEPTTLADVIQDILYRQAERDKLTAERGKLNQQYYSLKNEVAEAEQIRKSVYSIMRQEQRESQPYQAQEISR